MLDILSTIAIGVLDAFISIIRTLLATCFIGAAGIAVTGQIIFMKVRPDLEECRRIADEKIAAVSEDDFIRGQDTYIYDKDGNMIGMINAGHFEYVEIDQISKKLQDLYISQEDKRFMEHSGVDYIAMIRAGLAYAQNNGEITQGGSTITQQVIKNTYLTQEKTFRRKLIEIFMAPEMEKKYSKSKILEFYCNSNYFGNRCYGVQSASQYYFGVDAADLTVAQSALLVGLSNSPSAYDPSLHPEEALHKRDSVIEKAYENGFITEEEMQEALDTPLEIVEQIGPQTVETYQSTYALHCSTLKLMEKRGFWFRYLFENKEDYDAYQEGYEREYDECMEQIRTGGYNIYTSLDSGLQQMAQEQLDSALSSFTEVQDNGKYAMQGAIVLADNKTGYVVAIVGGRGTDDQFNRAYLSARQPGSSIKPLLVYAPAFDTGRYSPGSVVNDHLFEDGPKNSGGSYHGYVSIREALNRSLNTVAWQVLADIGNTTGLNYLSAMEFQKLSYIDNTAPAISIGGFTNGVRVVDMAKGFQTLANGGVYYSDTCILKLIDRYGDDVLSGMESKVKQVYSPDTAYMVTDILKGTMNSPYGTGRGLGLKNMPAAGKTGTTNSSKDTWFCGYTRYYTAAVWVGYDRPRAMPGVYGATYAGKIWRDLMNRVHEGLEPEDWTCPETVKKGSRDGVYDLYSTLFGVHYSEAVPRRETRPAEESSAEVVVEAFYDVNRQEFEQALSAISGLQYRTDDLESRIGNLTGKLAALNGYEAYDECSGRAAQAIARARSLPDYSTWKAQRDSLGPAFAETSGDDAGDSSAVGPGGPSGGSQSFPTPNVNQGGPGVSSGGSGEQGPVTAPGGSLKSPDQSSQLPGSSQGGGSSSAPGSEQTSPGSDQGDASAAPGSSQGPVAAPGSQPPAEGQGGSDSSGGEQAAPAPTPAPVSGPGGSEQGPGAAPGDPVSAAPGT